MCCINHSNYIQDPSHHLHQNGQPQGQFYQQQLANGSSAGPSSSFQVNPSVNPNSNGNIVLYPLNGSASTNGDATASSSTNGRPSTVDASSTNPALLPVVPSTAQRSTHRVTQDWQGSYPSQPPPPVTFNPMDAHMPITDPWLQEEFPEIDLSTPLSEYWCTINYFEGDLQVGDVFKVRSSYNSVIIDGFFDASRKDRFCLGALTNVQRTSASEKSRLFIGKGVQLENIGSDGSVYVRCLSEYSVFFESYYLDRESGREAFDAVHKIYPGSHVKVFSLRECLRCLKMAAQMQHQQQQSNGGNSATNGGDVGQNGTSSGNQSGLNIDDLRKLCRLRFSFVKGWGPDYPRKTILETPCWCEVQLNRPLQYLDQLLNSISMNTNLSKF
jgi:hypothetical protein